MTRHETAPFWSMLALRALVILLVFLAALRGDWATVGMHVPILLITAPLIWFGREDHHYYWLDVAIMGIFGLALLNGMLFSWPDYHSLFSYDKLFHAAGGAWVACLAAVALRKRIGDRAAFYASIIAFAIAVGAFWEVFEWVLSVLPPPFYVQNTGLADGMMDIIADTAGAALAALILGLRRYI